MSLSLESAVRTCSVNTGEANRIQSDRFLNPTQMVCIPWDGVNNKGQFVCPDSNWTKTAGCNSAEDRVEVENVLRPQYMNYITLGAQGIKGDIYGNQAAFNQSIDKSSFDLSRNKYTGNFGKQFGSEVAFQGCSVGAYERGMAEMAQAERRQAFMQNGYKANAYRRNAGD